jgi:hypothetical protein
VRANRELKLEGPSPQSIALLIQAVIWTALSLATQVSWDSVLLSCTVFLFGLIDCLYRIVCIRLAHNAGIEIKGVSDVLSDGYLRHLQVFLRVKAYIFFQAFIFLVGVGFCFLCVIVQEERLVLCGALLCFTSFLKMIPIYPTDGGIVLLQALRIRNPLFRILFENIGCFAVACFFSLLVSFSLGLLFLIPAFVLPLRIQSLYIRYVILIKGEEELIKTKSLINDEDLKLYLQDNNEFKRVNSVCNDEEICLFMENLVKEIPRFPLRQYEGVKLCWFFAVLLFVQFFVIIFFTDYFVKSARFAVEKPLLVHDCKQAFEELRSHRGVLEIAGDFDSLQFAVRSCKKKSKQRSILKGLSKRIV